MAKKSNAKVNKNDYQIIKNIISEYINLEQSQKYDFVMQSIQNHLHLKKEIEKIYQSDLESRENILETLPIQCKFDTRVKEFIELNSDQLKKYDIIEKIGSGGMSEVYLARQKHPVSRNVALKVLKQVQSHSQIFEETKKLAQLNHPNIATIHEIDQTIGEVFFIVMELIEGRDIVTYCENNQFNLKLRIQLFQQVCHAISHAHEKGIIHCDIKPSNVLVTHKNNEALVKVIDFGVSRFKDDVNIKLAGTPAYISPELLQGESEFALDTRHDVYALGVLLHRLVYDCMPDQKSLKNIVKDLQAIISKAHHHEPEHRYPSPLSLSEDLQRYLNKEVVHARKPSIWYASLQFIKRRTLLVTMSLALLAITIAGYYAQYLQAQEAMRAKTEAEEISSFLINLFDVANPDKSQSNQVSAIELINKAKDELLQLENPSLSDSKFMHTIGSIYIRMDQLEMALMVLQKSLKVKLDLLPSHHLEIIDSYIQLGLLKRKQLKYEEAKVYLSQAIELLEFQASPDTKRLGVAYNHLGNLYWSLVLTDDSIAAHKKALKFRLKNKDYVLIADSYNNIGVQYRVKKDWDASANYFQLAEKYYDQYSPGHPYSFYVKNNMAYVQEQRFKWQEVLRLYKETLAGFTKAYGDEHFNTLTVKKNLAKFYTRRLLNQQSIDIWHEIIETYEISSKIEELAVSYSYLAHNYFQINQIEKSLKYYQKSMELIENVQIKNKREVADIFAFYALTYLELKQFEKAEQLTQKGIDLFSEENELGNSYRMFFINQLGDIKLITQQPLKAQRLFQQVLDLMNLNVAQNKVEKIKAFIGLSKIQLNFKNYDNALLNITKALDLAQQLYGKNHRLIAQVQFHLGEIYNEINQRNKALEHLNKALEIQKLVLAKGHKDLLATKLMIESLD